MFPVLFRIGSFEVTSFGVMLFLSFVTAAWIAGKQLERYNMAPELVWDSLVAVAIGGILGAKLYYLALHASDVAADPMGSLLSRGGLVWYGGLIGGVSAFYFYIRRKKLPTALMYDSTAPALAIAYAVGRLGCFLVGDDYGRPTDAWYGIAFPEGSPPSTAGNLRAIGVEVDAAIPDATVLAVHPTQLYEIALAPVMFAILWRMGRKHLREGQLFALYMMLYGVERFVIEFVRAKGDRYVLGFSTSQLASMALLAAGVYLWNRRSTAPVVPLEARDRRKRETARAATRA
jgi:phosphatidylglycerol:prolipoprotein diacylglycerol transferase